MNIFLLEDKYFGWVHIKIESLGWKSTKLKSIDPKINLHHWYNWLRYDDKACNLVICLNF